MDQRVDWRKYVFVLFITILLFLTAYYVSNYFGNKKINELKSIQDKLAISILSSETEFSLLSELSCKNISGGALSDELDDLGGKLEWGQKNLGNTEEVANLKKYYSLLEIKDYLLTKRISARCGTKASFVLYFYTTAENCSECEKQGIVLSSLREKYPDLRVYSFDFSIDLSAVKAMLQIFKIEDTKLPALVIDEDLYTGFRGVEELDKIVKKSFKLQEFKTPTTQDKNP